MIYNALKKEFMSNTPYLKCHVLLDIKGHDSLQLPPNLEKVNVVVSVAFSTILNSETSCLLESQVCPAIFNA